MNRRTFLRVAGAGCAALAARAPGARALAAAAEAGKEAIRHPLVLSAPLTHSDWMLHPGVAWGAEGVRHMLDLCKASGLSRIYWRALDGGRALYASKLLRPENQWDADSFYTPQTEEDAKLVEKIMPGLTAQRRAEFVEQFKRLDYGRFDPLAEAVRYGHSIGLQVHAWVSVYEDDHAWGLRSELSKRHPVWRWRRRDGRLYHSQMSFAFEGVRAFKLAVLEELLRRYEIDGLFLDWVRTGDVRDNPQTDSTGTADWGYEQPLVEQFRRLYGLGPHEVANDDERWVRVRCGPHTEFMRGVRRRVAAVRDVPVAVMVGHPWMYRGLGDKINGNLKGYLLDLPTWAAEGLIDAAVAAGYYRDGGTPALAYQALRKEVGPDVDVWAYGWVPQDVPGFERDCALARELGVTQLLLWEADYLETRPNRAELQEAMRKAASAEGAAGATDDSAGPKPQATTKPGS